MELDEIREYLNNYDAELIRILAKRQKLIPKVAKYKKENNLQRYQPEREKEIIESKRKLAINLGLDPDLVEDIIKKIIENSHKIEKEIIGK
ncbi:MAG: chorismate mutase [Nanoarchaeota archaeon]